MHHNITLCLHPVSKCKGSLLQSPSRNTNKGRKKRVSSFLASLRGRQSYGILFKGQRFLRPLSIISGSISCSDISTGHHHRFLIYFFIQISAVLEYSFYFAICVSWDFCNTVVAWITSILRLVNIFQTGRCAFSFRTNAQNSQCQDYWIIFFYYSTN